MALLVSFLALICYIGKMKTFLLGLAAICGIKREVCLVSLWIRTQQSRQRESGNLVLKYFVLINTFLFLTFCRILKTSRLNCYIICNIITFMHILDGIELTNFHSIDKCKFLQKKIIKYFHIVTLFYIVVHHSVPQDTPNFVLKWEE